MPRERSPAGDIELAPLLDGWQHTAHDQPPTDLLDGYPRTPGRALSPPPQYTALDPHPTASSSSTASTNTARRRAPFTGTTRAVTVQQPLSTPTMRADPGALSMLSSASRPQQEDDFAGCDWICDPRAAEHPDQPWVPENTAFWTEVGCWVGAFLVLLCTENGGGAWGFLPPPPTWSRERREAARARRRQ